MTRLEIASWIEGRKVWSPTAFAATWSIDGPPNLLAYGPPLGGSSMNG